MYYIAFEFTFIKYPDLLIVSKSIWIKNRDVNILKNESLKL